MTPLQPSQPRTDEWIDRILRGFESSHGLTDLHVQGARWFAEWLKRFPVEAEAATPSIGLPTEVLAEAIRQTDWYSAIVENWTAAEAAANLLARLSEEEQARFVTDVPVRGRTAVSDCEEAG